MPRALILAAGEGRRFGGPKQLAEIDGRPMLAHVIALAAAYDPLVVLGAHADAIRAAVDVGDHIVASDWADGQAASLRAGVAAIGDADSVLVLLGDQPFLTGDAIEAVLAAGPPARATYDGAPGHPVLLDRALLGRIPGLSGDQGARDLLAEAQRVEVGHLCDPRDVDTPADL
jgi:CTP:molybdopterin cytidylyltransferase MocA